MSDLNSVLLEGVIDRELEYKHPADGKATCIILLSSTRHIKIENEMVKQKINILVLAEGRLAEICARQLTANKGIRVVGRLGYIQDKGLGIIAEHCEFQQQYKYGKTKEAKA